MKTPKVQFQFCARWLFRLVFILLVTKMVRMKSKPQVGVSVVTKAQTIKANISLIQLHDLNANLNLEYSALTEEFIQQFLNKMPQPVFFERLQDVTLSRSQDRVESCIDFSPYKNIPYSLTEYANSLKRTLHHYANIRYSPVNRDQPIMYEEKRHMQSFHKILAECIEEVKLITALITNSHSQCIRILDLTSDDNSRTDEQEPRRSKRSVFGSVIRWLFGGLGGTDENVQ